MPKNVFLPLLAAALYFVGSAEFMFSALLMPLARAFETTPERASLLIVAYALAYAVVAPVFGYCLRRKSRRSLLLGALLLFAADSFALVLAPSLRWAILLRMVGGVASAVLVPTAFALIAETLPAHRHTGAMGFVMFGMTLGIASGPALAGLMSDMLGWRAPLILTGSGCLLLCGVGWRTIPEGAPMYSHAKTGYPRVWRDAGLMRLLIGKGLWNGAAVAAFLLAGEIIRARYLSGATTTGLMLAAFGLGLGAGNLAAGFVRRLAGSDPAVLLLALPLLLLSLAVFLLPGLTREIAVICLGLCGSSLGLAAAASTSLLARRAGDNKVIVLAVSESFNNASLMLILPVAATLMSRAESASSALALLAPLSVGTALAVLACRDEIKRGIARPRAAPSRKDLDGG